MASSDSRSSLPLGWGDRTNAMSERDIALGGDAQNKFANKSAYCDGTQSWKTSDQVREHYLRQMEEAEREGTAAADVAGRSKGAEGGSLPVGWEHRQRQNAVEAKQHGVFARETGRIGSAISVRGECSTPSSASTPQAAVPRPKNEEDGFVCPEIALVRIATQSLDAAASALLRANGRDGGGVKVSADDRAALAAAMRKAMDAVARC